MQMKLKRSVIAFAVLTTLLNSAVIGIGQAPAKSTAVGLDPKRLERLSAQLDAYAKDKLLSGGVLFVAHKGKVAFKHAFGQRDVESSSPMKEDAIFRIASQTKAFVSVGVMILQEEGKLLISDPASKFIPEFAN